MADFAKVIHRDRTEIKLNNGEKILVHRSCPKCGGLLIKSLMSEDPRKEYCVDCSHAIYQ